MFLCSPAALNVLPFTPDTALPALARPPPSECPVVSTCMPFALAATVFVSAIALSYCGSFMPIPWRTSLPTSGPSSVPANATTSFGGSSSCDL